MAFTATAKTETKKNFSAADYERATKVLGANTGQLIDPGNVSPTWLADGKFWYNVSTATGIAYVLINPDGGSRKTSADKKRFYLMDEVMGKYLGG